MNCTHNRYISPFLIRPRVRSATFPPGEGIFERFRSRGPQDVRPPPASVTHCPRRLAACRICAVQLRAGRKPPVPCVRRLATDTEHAQWCNDTHPAGHALAGGHWPPCITCPYGTIERYRAVPNGVTITEPPGMHCPAALRPALAGGPAALRAEITPGQLQPLVAAGGYFMEQ